jgi:hypothetical protein
MRFDSKGVMTKGWSGSSPRDADETTGGAARDRATSLLVVRGFNARPIAPEMASIRDFSAGDAFVVAAGRPAERRSAPRVCGDLPGRR